MTRLGKMSTDSKELCRIAWKRNSLFVQINQDHHIEGMKHRPLIVRLALRYSVSSLTACGCPFRDCSMYNFHSSTTKPKMSTLMVACCRSLTEACGRDDTTKVVSYASVYQQLKYLSVGALGIHCSHQRGRQNLYLHC